MPTRHLPFDGWPFALFGLGQFSRSALWCTSELLIGYHLVQRVGLSGRTAGAILFATYLASAVPDLFIAGWMFRRAAPVATALRLQWRSGGAALATALLLFAPPPFAGWDAIVWVVSASIAFRFAYALYDVSQNALISLLPRDAAEARRYVANKTVASSFGRLFASLLVAAAILARDQLADLRAIVVVVGPVVVSAAVLRGLRPTEPTVPTDQGTAGALRSLPLRPFAAPMLATACGVGLLGLTSRLLPLFGEDHPGSASGARLVIAMVCGTISGPLIDYVGGATRKWRAWWGAGLSIAAAAAGSGLLLPLGATVSLGLSLVYGAALSGLTNRVWEQTARAVGDQARRTGERIDALAFALITTTIKISIALSSALFGAVLDAFRAGTAWSVAVIAAVLAVGGVGSAVALVAGEAGFPRPWTGAGRRRAGALAEAGR